MIVQKSMISKLKELGLNSYEGKLWTALLSRGISTAGELSDIAGVPRSRAYDVLEGLEKRGFIMMKLGKPIKYIAVNPEEAINRVKKGIISDAESKADIINELQGSKLLEELSALHTNGIEMIEPTDLSGAIKGRGNITNHIESMVRGAKSSIMIMTTEEGASRKLAALKPHLKKASSKGVKIKVIAPVNVGSELHNEFSSFGELRNLPHIGRMVIVDGKEALLMMTNDKDVHSSFDAGLWVTSSYLVGALSSMFESAWK